MSLRSETIWIDRLFEVAIIGGGMLGWAAIAWVTGMPGILGMALLGLLAFLSIGSKVLR